MSWLRCSGGQSYGKEIKHIRTFKIPSSSTINVDTKINDIIIGYGAGSYAGSGWTVTGGDVLYNYISDGSYGSFFVIKATSTQVNIYAHNRSPWCAQFRRLDEGEISYNVRRTAVNSDGTIEPNAIGDYVFVGACAAAGATGKFTSGANEILTYAESAGAYSVLGLGISLQATVVANRGGSNTNAWLGYLYTT